MSAAATGGAEDHRNRVALAIMFGCGELHYRIERGGDEIRKLKLDHRPQAHQRGAIGEAAEAVFAHGRVNHPAATEFCVQTGGGFERAAELSHVLADNEHPLVRAHFLKQRLIDGLKESNLRHKRRW